MVASVKLRILGLLMLIVVASQAQPRAQEPPRQDQGLHPIAPSDPAAIESNDGPVRMARFSYLDGNVVWRPGAGGEWAAAPLNLPIRESAEIWVSDGARAEVQFDDGSLLRVGSGGVVVLKSLYSDSKGEFTEIELTDGLCTLKARTEHSIYQVDTSRGSVTATGPSELRVAVAGDVKIAVHDGSATFEGPESKLPLKSGDYIDVTSDSAALQPQPLPPADDWDKFNVDRDTLLAHPDPKLPENMAYIQPDLDKYGAWEQNDDGTQVWAPNVDNPNWLPYFNGSWTWVEPFGWSWVSNEPWGWVPYHYGTWKHRARHWVWVPGPSHQNWSPGSVAFTYMDDKVYWAPLSPKEVTYSEEYDLGLAYGNWTKYFSIGKTAIYDRKGAHFYARPLGNGYANHGRFVMTNWQDRVSDGQRFVPENADFGAAGTSLSDFKWGGKNTTVLDGRRVFEQGRNEGISDGFSLLSGPALRPQAHAWTPDRTVVPVASPPTGLSRPVFRAGAQETSYEMSSPTKGTARLSVTRASRVKVPAPRQPGSSRHQRLSPRARYVRDRGARASAAGENKRSRPRRSSSGPASAVLRRGRRGR